MLATEPLWRANVVLRTMPRQTAHGCSLLSVLTGLIREQGLLAQWNGVSVSLWLVCNPVLQFLVYDIVKQRLLRGKAGGGSLTAAQGFVVGAFSKAVAAITTYANARLHLFKFVTSCADILSLSPRHACASTKVPPNSKPPHLCLTLHTTQTPPCCKWSARSCGSKARNNPEFALYFLFRDTVPGPIALYRGCSAKLAQTVLTAAFMFGFYERIHSSFVSLLNRTK